MLSAYYYAHACVYRCAFFVKKDYENVEVQIYLKNKKVWVVLEVSVQCNYPLFFSSF